MGGFRALRGLVAGDRRAKKSRRRSSLFEREAQLDIVRHLEGAAAYPEYQSLRFRAWRNTRESDMMSETQIYAIARQMIDKHGFEAIAQAAKNALACEGK